jgi:hypothetical protein
MFCFMDGDDPLSLKGSHLIAEIVRLRSGIRAHRDSGHDLCWQHPQLWTCYGSQFKKRSLFPGAQFLRLHQIPGGTRIPTQR